MYSSNEADIAAHDFAASIASIHSYGLEKLQL
jgi:hypothetical protein